MPLPLLTDVVVVSLIGAAGVATGQGIAALSERGKARHAEKGELITMLSARVDKLEARIEALEADKEELTTALREAERFAWHILEYLRVVLSYARKLAELLPPDVEQPPEPVPPDSVKDHL